MHNAEVFKQGFASLFARIETLELFLVEKGIVTSEEGMQTYLEKRDRLLERYRLLEKPEKGIVER